MKIFIPLIAMIVLFTVSAFAHDMTYMGTVKPGGTKELVVQLPAGKSVVEVYGSNKEHMTCQFIDNRTGMVAFLDKDSVRCVGTSDLTLPANITVKISNLETTRLDFKIWVHDPE